MVRFLLAGVMAISKVMNSFLRICSFKGYRKVNFRRLTYGSWLQYSRTKIGQVVMATKFDDQGWASLLQYRWFLSMDSRRRLTNDAVGRELQFHLGCHRSLLFCPPNLDVSWERTFYEEDMQDWISFGVQDSWGNGRRSLSMASWVISSS